MTKGQPCYLLLCGDDPAEASFCDTLGQAQRQFMRVAEELDRYGQEIEGSVHFVDQQGDDWVEYPDRVLRLGPRGGCICELT